MNITKNSFNSMIIIKIQGGLCNQLFQWALGYSLSKHHEVYFDDTFFSLQHSNPLVTVRRYELEDIIKPDVPLVTPEVNSRLLSSPTFRVADNFHYQNFHFDPGVNYILDGYWQSEKYFSSVVDELPNLFNWPDIKQLDFNNSCSIHIRRGDYLNTQHIHPIQSIQYYNKAIDIIGKYDNIYIFSDDIQWCKENLNFKNSIFMEGNSNLEDLRYMSLCSHNIIANSSFSWWGAYLNQNKDKKVICPKLWFGDGTNDSDLKPLRWIQI